MNELSIILCFYNAEHKLSKTINHLKQLNVAGLDGVELLFIDNNSNDGSCDLIKKECSDLTTIRWEIIFEPKPGLVNARLCGFREARYDTLLFCDDDNWLSKDYVIKGLRILNEHPKIAVLGGFGIAISDIELPTWFEKNKNFYAVGEQMPQSGEVKGIRNVVYGAGMFVRKQAFKQIVSKGFRFYSVGRQGKMLSSGEDSEMCLAFKIAGYVIWYERSLEFYHYISPNRLTVDYLNKLKNGIGQSGYVTRFYREYLYGYVPKVNRWFWVKEFLYATKDWLSQLFSGASEKGSNYYMNFLKYLLKNRFKYNNDVSRVISICKKLDKVHTKN